MLCSKAKTRRLSDGCSGIVRKANPQVCRAGGLQPNEMVCQRRFDKIRREDDRRCSCPSTWGHSSRLHGRAIPHHFFPTLDQAGFNFPNYQPGTLWCDKCRSEAPQRIQNWPKSDKSENISTECSQQDHTQVSFLNMFIFVGCCSKKTWNDPLLLIYLLVLCTSEFNLFNLFVGKLYTI